MVFWKSSGENCSRNKKKSVCLWPDGKFQLESKKTNKKGSLSALVSFDSVRDFLGEERQSMESRDFRFRMGSLRNSLLMASYFSVK